MARLVRRRSAHRREDDAVCRIERDGDRRRGARSRCAARRRFLGERALQSAGCRTRARRGRARQTADDARAAAERDERRDDGPRARLSTERRGARVRAGASRHLDRRRSRSDAHRRVRIDGAAPAAGVRQRHQPAARTRRGACARNRRPDGAWREPLARDAAAADGIVSRHVPRRRDRPRVGLRRRARAADARRVEVAAARIGALRFARARLRIARAPGQRRHARGRAGRSPGANRPEGADE